MGFITGLLGGFLGLIIAVIAICAVVYFKVKKSVGSANMNELMKAAKNAKNIEAQEYSRQKSVRGITKLIEPEIIRDFGDFNKDYLFTKVEKNLRTILTALEDKSESLVQNDPDLIYMYGTVRDHIQDMRGQNINIKYDNIVFHEHAIKNYNKAPGRATITVSTTLEYYYSNDSQHNKKKEFNGIKKQTRYTTQYVYIYDESKFQHNERNFGISCPNCGAPLEFLGAGNCAYCGIYIKPINLKNWFMVSYKEDYPNS